MSLQGRSTHVLVGSHLFKLQLSEHIGYLTKFNKVTPTISGYFRRWEAGLAVEIAHIKCFSACSTHCMAGKDTGQLL